MSDSDRRHRERPTSGRAAKGRDRPTWRCVCPHGPILTATFRCQELVRVAREHPVPSCPMPAEEIDPDVYSPRIPAPVITVDRRRPAVA